MHDSRPAFSPIGQRRLIPNESLIRYRIIIVYLPILPSGLMIQFLFFIFEKSLNVYYANIRRR